jgi:hypothetical protein
MGWQQDNELVCVGCSASLSEQVTLISLLATPEICDFNATDTASGLDFAFLGL